MYFVSWDVSLMFVNSSGQAQVQEKCQKKKSQGFFLLLIARTTVTTTEHIFPLIISMHLTGFEKITVISGSQTYAVRSMLK